MQKLEHFWLSCGSLNTDGRLFLHSIPPRPFPPASYNCKREDYDDRSYSRTCVSGWGGRKYSYNGLLTTLKHLRYLLYKLH
jgi:hypothetical protein